MIRPSDHHVQVAVRLARTLIETSNADDVRRILQAELGTPRADGPARPAARAAEHTDIVVGIWKAVEEDGARAFSRVVRQGEPWRLWANVDRIPPKGARRRVVLVGESVARGYLYDPTFNCARALASLLQGATGADDFEIVDLARNGLLFHQIPGLVTAALSLEPDAFVLFAGNNWRLPNGVRVGDLVGLLRAGASWTEVGPLVAAAWRNEIQLLLRALAATCAARDIPVVLVVPEANLADWHYDDGWHSPLLDDGERAAWTELKRTVLRALDEGQLDRAAALAQQMIALDGGVGPLPHEVLGAWHAGRGDHLEARRMLEKARNACLVLPVTKEPGCYPIVQQVLRDEVPPAGIHVVDLPQRCTEVLEGRPPGRALFLDYCHMNARGMRLAMASAAEALLPLFGKRRCSWRQLDGLAVQPPAQTEGEAHLGAAVVTALFGRRCLEVVRFHIAEAVRQCPEIVDVVSLLAGVHLRRGPLFMSASFHELWSKRERFPVIEELAPAAGAGSNDLNATLAHALTDVVCEHLPADAASLRELLLSQYGVPEAPARLNLLDRSYCEPDLTQLEYEWLRKSIYLTARRSRSLFRLILRKPSDVTLTLTFRIRAGETDERPIALWANDVHVATLAASDEWRTQTVTVPGCALVAGFNAIALQWTAHGRSREQRTDEMLCHLADADETQALQQCIATRPLYAAFGDVHEFWASAVPLDAPAHLQIQHTLSTVSHV